jgi:23S rRNA (cytidine2498-2'-O)-methyltransferase
MPQFILTADPSFIDLALTEARKDATDLSVDATLAPGVLLLTCTEGFWGLAESWRTDPPIFARHICPVDVAAPLSGTADDLLALVDAVEREILELFDPELPFSVQTRLLADVPYKPFDVNRAISDRITQRTGTPLNVPNPIQILSVVIAPSPISNTQSPISAHIGLSLADYNLSSWAGGEHRFAREKGQISRAEFKLLEALDVFGIDLPARGVALDLGAAPGGWTRILRQRDQFVTAVDPAELDPRLAADKGVRHKRVTAEEYLADDPDEFDLIVNDMRMDARDSARLMVRYARQLYPHGMALMTFKLPEEGRKVIFDHAFKLLRGAYTIAAARQLFHNRSEITVWLRKK